ncbi:MAG: response regulator transcription factor [Candidatus Omnitrophica bacterium]|nr:response regulator transcription factor [Candidatus Omnitrophota bacterium]
MKERILIIEDDKNISKLIKYNLEKEGFNCFTALKAEEALETLKRFAIDLIILDIMLPDMDGFELCRLIKEEKKLKRIPIIMLTAKGEEVDKVVGFQLGADDYMVKPFSPRELIMRIKAVLRRGKKEEDKKEILQSGNLLVDIPRHKVFINDREVELTALEFKLLVTLMERRGRVQSRELLLSDVWGIYTQVNTRTVDTHIKRLRQKLGKLGKLIETVIGLGYRFKEEDEN